MPVREQFLYTETKSDEFKRRFRKKCNISEQKTLIMVMLGGRGSVEMLTMAYELAKVKGEVHFLFCIGSAEELREPLAKIIATHGMSSTIVLFTREIASYMAISDLLITKSGGQTLCEALYMQLPVLLDGRSKALPWEKMNRDFVLKKNMGILLSDIKILAPMMQKIIDSPEQLETWRRNITSLQLPNPQIGVQNTLKQLLRKE